MSPVVAAGLPLAVPPAGGSYIQVGGRMRSYAFVSRRIGASAKTRLFRCDPPRHPGPALAHFPGEGSGAMNVDAVANRVRAEFVEMPGLTLTVGQASRLFGLDQDICRQVVDRLV